MSLHFFIGPAGSGKTTRLIEEVGVAIRNHPLGEHRKVLALTKIHGSRRRLHLRLTGLPELNKRFDCMTADSFARRLLCRWRSLSRLRFGPEPSNDDHDEFCRRAGDLISEKIVSQWVTGTYPIVVVDEMQDSKGGQLKMFQVLAGNATFLAAGDDFQDLDAEIENPAVLWATRNGKVVPLSQIHRTDVQGLLDAAGAIRGSKKIPNGPGFEIVFVPKHHLGAWHTSKHINKWRKCGSLAIITPTGPDKSPFVRGLIERVESGPIGQKWKFGPYSVPWEISQEAVHKQFVDEIGFPRDSDQKITVEQLHLDPSHGPSAALLRWFERQRKVSARTEFSAAEVVNQISLIFQRYRAFGHSWNRRVYAMTIHQAKNREFDSVIVLWPFQVQGSDERHRRLLYNAITRAKKQALVIVQDPKKNRGKSPPFTL